MAAVIYPHAASNGTGLLYRPTAAANCWGGGDLFLKTVAASSVPPMPFASKEKFLKLLHGREHKGKKVEELFNWRVIPKPPDEEAIWPHVVMTVRKPSCPCVPCLSALA